MIWGVGKIKGTLPVHATIVATLQELSERVNAAVATFSPDLLSSKWIEIECR